MGVKYAVVGGIAVSFRSVVRTTNDLDLAVIVNHDSEAESIVRDLIGLGYRAEVLLESEVSGRLATVRMISAGEREVFVDMLFASSGIEPEVVESSSLIEVFPGLALRVASRSALIALKVLSANSKSRIKDIIDLQNLLNAASARELTEARQLLDLITERGFNRNKNLSKDFVGYLNQFGIETS
ncbi:MAG: nucleotidyl transferase AbiEii/AbiGii toxin family protein [Pyrinomonadaceae bacterium]